jgi:crotonobetainyl-CoA:carnitine CoA-transferase CaiB-like acyl-CoA transferase
MFESLVSFLFAEHLSGHVFRPPLDTLFYERVVTPFRRPYRTADGFIVLLPYSTRHWERFLTLVGREDLAAADWVCDSSLRSERIGELYQVIAETMPRHTSADWLRMLKEIDIPCGPVNTLEDLLSDPHLQAVDFFQNVDHPTEGPITAIRHPIRYLGAREKPDIPAPALDQDAAAILAEAGVDEQTIAELTGGSRDKHKSGS